ncbi:MAG: hypothetical protein AB7G24_00740 [Novosphingobium sp.]
MSGPNFISRTTGPYFIERQAGPQAFVDAGDSAGAVAAAMAVHVAAADPHPGYLTEAAAAAGYQPLDADLTAIAALATTAFGRSLLVVADATAARTAIGAGTVSSVALSLPSIFSVSGSPITASGTLTATLASQTANQFFAAPNGSAGAPAFRAIVAADIPTLNQNTTGSAASLTTGRTIGMTGDVVWTSPDFNGTANVSAAGTIQVGVVSLAKMADVATGTLFYRKTAGTGAPEVQTLATLKTDLGLTGTNSGDQTITLTGDVTGSGTGSFAATIANGAVSLAKMANMATASVIYRKTAGSGPPEVQTLATLKTDLGLTGTNSGDQTITLTGDVTGSGTGSFAASIANDAVSNLKLANMATATFKGRVTAGTGDPEDLTGTQATTLLDVFTTSLKGLAPASGGGTTNFLRADGTWAAPPGGGGVSDGDKGDITVSASGATWTIDAGVVSLAKMANMATASVIYRKTAGSGAPEVQTLATLKTDLGLTGTNSGDQTITLTGDVTGSGTGSFAASIANDAVSNLKLANMATATFKGRVTAGTGDPEDLTGTQATTLLDVFTSGLKGLAPASGGGTTNFLRADGTWAAPPGGGGGWTQIGSTATPSGVSSVEFNDIATSYSELFLRCEGISHNFGSNTALRVNFSDDGVNWTGDYTWGTAASAAVAWYGALHIPYYTGAAGIASGAVADLTSNNSLGSSTGVAEWRCAGGVTDIRVKVNGGNFDAGTLKLYGR